MRLPAFAAALVCLVAFALPVNAQSNRGTITGTVTDPNGAVVAGAKVTATHITTGTVREATTGDDGTYSIPALDPGDYRIVVAAQGFAESTVDQVKLETGARQAVDVTVNVAGVGGDTVVVTAEAPLTESESSVRGELITGRQVTELPIPQRNFTLLATLAPGVTRPAVGVLGGGGNFASNGPTGASTESTRFRESGGSVLVVNGARPTNNNFLLDGVDNNEGQFAQIATYPPPDAVAEFRVQTSVAPAEYGRAGGGIISVTTRSGGNEFHGSLYTFYQGRVLSARSRTERGNAFLPNRNTYQYGGTIGGPVFLPRPGEGGPRIYDGRNRTFFFVYYEGQRNATPSTTGDFGFVSVPTARMRVGDFGELLQPGTSREFTLFNGATVTAPIGTVFCPSGTPAPANDIRGCGVPLSQVGLNTLQAYPLPTRTDRIFDNFQTNRKEKFTRSALGLRFDHAISDNNNLFFAYSEDESSRARDNNFPLGTSPTGNDLPSGFGAGDEFGDSRGVRLGDTHTFSPTVINEARFGVTRVEIGIFNTGVGGALGFDPNVSANLGFEGVNICGECTGAVLLGIEEPNQRGRQNQLEFIGDGGPFYFLSNNYSVADALTVVRGTHTFRFGGDLRVRQNSNFDAGRAGAIKSQLQYGTGVGGFLSGNYSGVGIGPRDSGSGVANFLFGYAPAFISRGTPGTAPYLSNKEIAFYAQDDWKVNPELTLNLGLRYDIFTSPTERFDRQTNYDPATDTLTRAGENARGGRDLVDTDRNNFGPRLGFAYSGLREDKSVVVRGGVGVIYSTDTPGVPGVLSANPPGAASFSCTLQTIGTAACPQVPANFTLDSPIPFPSTDFFLAPGATAAAPAGSNLIRLDPDNQNARFLQYNLTAQWEFAPNFLAEVGYVGSRGRNLLTIQNIGNAGAGGFPGSREVANRNTVQNITDDGRSWYDSFQSKLERRYSGGLSFIATYVFSKALDNSPGGFCLGGTGPRSCGFANPLRPELDKGPAFYDVPHRFVFANVWDVPFGRGRRFAGDIPRGLDYIIGGWQLNNVITIQSGPPFSITAFGVRADVVPNGTTTCPRIEGQNAVTPRVFEGQTFCPAVTRVFASDPEFSTSNPTQLANVPRFGNTGRNIFRGQRQEFWDASLFKNIRFTETTVLELRAQFYNVLNHLNGFTPVGDLTSNDFGRDLAEQNRRQLEFGFRLRF
jgi:hypothetical protein